MAGIIISTYALPIILALIMFNLGLSLTFASFKTIFAQPKPLFVGLAAQMIFLPTIAFILAYISNLSPEFKIGIVLIAICPGGVTSNLVTYILRGNVALSIALTSVNSILILLSIPVMLYLGVYLFTTDTTFITLPFWQTVLNVFLMIIIPVTFALFFKNKFPISAFKIERVLKYVSIILLIIVFSFAILLNKHGEISLLIYYNQVWPWVVALNILGMLAGLLISVRFKFSKDILITIPIEVGLQNSALAITIALSTSFLNNPLISVPATVYGTFTFFSTLLFGFLVKKFAK